MGRTWDRRAGSHSFDIDTRIAVRNEETLANILGELVALNRQLAWLCQALAHERDARQHADRQHRAT